MIKRTLTILVLGLFIVSCDPVDTFEDCQRQGNHYWEACMAAALGHMFVPRDWVRSIRRNYYLSKV